MNIEVGQLYMSSLNLMDKIEELKLIDGDERLINLLERAAELGNIATLNYEDLSEEELRQVKSILSLSEKQIQSEEPLMEGSSLEKVIESMETLFREKKMLLGKSKVSAVT